MLPKDVRVEHLAEACSVSVETLIQVSRNQDLLFQTRVRRRVKGRVRDIDPPTSTGRRLLRRLHRFLQKHFKPADIVHGGAKGRSCFSSARIHVGQRHIVTRDVFRCYPSISRGAMHSALLRYGFWGDTANVLADLLTIRGCISQGSPVSGDALNIVFFDFDIALSKFADATGCRASRTYDDIIVSTNDPRTIRSVERFIEDELSRLGLTISRRKVKRHGLQHRTNPKRRPPKVHSLVVSKGRGVAINKEQREKALEVGTRFKAGCRVASADSLEALARLRMQVVGHMRYTGQADVGPVRNLRQLLGAGDRALLKRLRIAGIACSGKPWHYHHGDTNEPARLATLWRKRLGHL